MALSADAPPLRILHVLRAPLGGLFRHVIDLTRAQVALGHSVGLIVDSLTGGATSDRLFGALEPTLGLGITRIPMPRQPHLADVAAFLRVVSRIETLRPDIVHGHGSKGALYARMAGFLPGKWSPVRGYTPHGGSFNYRPGSLVHRFFMLTEKLLARRTDILLFESAYIASRFDTFVGRTSALRRIVPNGIGSAEFVPVEPGPDAVEFLYVGELRSAKGINTLLAALALMAGQRPHVPQLALFGSGPDTEALRAQARHLGLAAHVHFRGPMPARTAFGLGRVLVVPSRAESLPYIVLEAAGARLPMVATNVGGIPEIFGPHAQRLIPCDDPIVLAGAMTAALDRPSEEAAAEAAELARYVEDRFSFERMVSAVIDGYRAALQAKVGTVRPA